jgi:hypothetical protein
MTSLAVSHWHSVEALNYWTWQIQGVGLSDSSLQSIAYQLITQIPYDEKIEWLSDSREIESHLTAEGLLSTLSLRLPYRIKQPGLVTLPALQLRYFDPQNGKLAVISSSPITILALPAWLVWILQWIALLGVLVLSFAGLWSLKQIWINRQLQQDIRQAQSVDVLWQALLDWRQKQSYQAWSFLPWRESAETGSLDAVLAAQSLDQWLQWYTQQFGQNEEFTVLIEQLNTLLYARQDQFDTEEAWHVLSNRAQAWSQALRWWQMPWHVIRLRLSVIK